jgi:hypothetical protein
MEILFMADTSFGGLAGISLKWLDRNVINQPGGRWNRIAGVTALPGKYTRRGVFAKVMDAR